MTRFASPFMPALVIAALLALPLPAAACDSDAFRALTQLAGDWQVFRDGELAGKLKMQPVSGGCAMLEEWHTVDGVEATALHWSESIIDEEAPEIALDVDAPGKITDGEVSETVLHQVYVDSRGWFIRADGNISEGVLVYEGKIKEDGQELVLRATLRGLGSDEIVHVGEVSTDAGETWQDSFTLIYRRTAAE